MRHAAVESAKMYAASINLGVGQFCTNPGLIIGVEGSDLNLFMETLGNEIKQVAPAKMLHAGIAKAYVEKLGKALEQTGVEQVATSNTAADQMSGFPAIASTDAGTFLSNPILHQEVFGPYSLIVKCKDVPEMLAVTQHLEGQLTCTIMATDNEIKENAELLYAVQDICGRIILNGVPTGVEVCLSMHHGGPFPSTTDARFSSVGADGIKRFARPLSFQNWGNELLPDELKNENPLGIWRTVNNQLSKEKLHA